MKDHGPAQLICDRLSRNTDAFDRVEYGVTGAFGGFRCESFANGLECRNLDNHAFFLSHVRQLVF